MPSIQHEALLQLFRNRPSLAAELLRDALHRPLPTFSEARVESAELTDIQPAEYRAAHCRTDRHRSHRSLCRSRP
jgi:hypothetical protein